VTPSIRPEAGSVTAMVCLVAVALFALIGLVVDGGRAVALRSAAMDEAIEAARAGAEQLSLGSLRSGVVSLDTSAAVNAARTFLAQSDLTGTVAATDQTVTVSLVRSEPTAILGLVGIRTLTVSVTASATDLHGVTEGD